MVVHLNFFYFQEYLYIQQLIYKKKMRIERSFDFQVVQSFFSIFSEIKIPLIKEEEENVLFHSV
jgi:hypothetical protein